MGFEMRRAMRIALGPGITGLQRAIALELADDARDESRLSFATLENLAEWTGAKDVNVVRNALKRLAAAGWEFRVPLGVGKDGRTLYAVPGKRVTFRVPDFEGGAPATPSGRKGVAGAPSEGAGARSQGAPAPSERAGATPFSSIPQSPHLSSAARAPEASPEPEDERENDAAPTKDKPTAAQKVVRASGAVTAAEESAFIAWVTVKHQVHSPGFWRTAADDMPELAEAWRADCGPAITAVKPWLIGLPPWCGNCGGYGSAAKNNPKFRTTTGGIGGEPCPDCHPEAQR